MKLTANITLDELTKSQVAERKGINNNPNPAQIENLKALATNILQPVRSHFDKPLIISSGFRCAQLCLEIGSSVNSQHVADNSAAAADFEIPGVDNRELATLHQERTRIRPAHLRILPRQRTDRQDGYIVRTRLTQIETNHCVLLEKMVRSCTNHG